MPEAYLEQLNHCFKESATYTPPVRAPTLRQQAYTCLCLCFCLFQGNASEGSVGGNAISVQSDHSLGHWLVITELLTVHRFLLLPVLGCPLELLRYVGAKSVAFPEELVSVYDYYKRGGGGVMQCHAVSRSVMQCHAVSCSVMQCHVVSHVHALQRVNARLRKSHVQERVKRLEEGAGLDWATAEALALGTLLYQGSTDL